MTQTPLARRMWYLYPYVLPAELLSDKPTHDGDMSSLRADASCEDTCYVRVLCAFGDGTPATCGCCVPLAMAPIWRV